MPTFSYCWQQKRKGKEGGGVRERYQVVVPVISYLTAVVEMMECGKEKENNMFSFRSYLSQVKLGNIWT